MKQFIWTEQQKEALQGSILKWEMIVEGTGFDNGQSDCPCCQIWIDDEQADCMGCPIAEFTGKIHCHGTPYYSSDCGRQKHAHSKDMLDYLYEILKAGDKT